MKLELPPDLDQRDNFFATLVAIAVVAIGVAMYASDSTFFWHDDFQTQHLPAAFEIARAWSHGELPLLAPGSWSAGALGAEFQYGVFSIFLTLCNLAVWALGLPLTTAAATLAVIHCTVAGVGAYHLGRAYRLPHSLSAVVALIAAYNGWLLNWGALTWYPALTSFAWIPWFWLGLQRLSQRPRTLTIVLTAIALYLTVAAGWPFTVLMAAMLATAYLVPELIAKRWRIAGAIVAAGALGLALSATPLLMLIEYVGSTARIGMSAGGGGDWVVPPLAFVGLVLPVLRSGWNIFGPGGVKTAIELSGGFIPLLGILMASVLMPRRFLRENARELALIAAVALLSMAPSFAMFRWSFRWLPLFHLALAIAGARGLAAVLESRPPQRSRQLLITQWNAGAWGAGMTVVAFVIALVRSSKAEMAMALGGLFLVLTILWTVLELGGSAFFTAAFPIGLTLVSLFAGYGFVKPADQVPVWRFDEVDVLDRGPYRPSRRYFAFYRFSDLMRRERRLAHARERHPLFRPGNVPMFAGLHFVNGYSPMQPRGIYSLLGIRLHGFIDLPAGSRLFHLETKPDALFDHLGVDGLVMTKTFLRSMNATGLPGWRVVMDYEDELLFERERPMRTHVRLATATRSFANEPDAERWIVTRTEAAMPFVFAERVPEAPCATAALSSVRVTRLVTAAMVDTTSCRSEAIVVFQRPWYPGFAGRVAGQPADVVKADLLMPALLVKPGVRAEVAVEYRPRGLRAGAAISALSVLLTALSAVLWRAVSRKA